MASASGEIGIVGLSLLVLVSLEPSGITFIIEISTILSVATFNPVVSISKNIMGFLRFSSIMTEVLIRDAHGHEKRADILIGLFRSGRDYQCGAGGICKFETDIVVGEI